MVEMRAWWVLVVSLGLAGTSLAAGKATGVNVVGPAACASCHPRETEVWKGSKHFRAFDGVEKNPKFKDILAATGGASMKTSATCTLCHFTMVSSGGGKAVAKAGPSCEGCHGAAAGWVKIHGDYGKGFAPETEPAAHRDERRAKSVAAGMHAAQDLYDIASNCAVCHGLAHPDLASKTLEKMLEAGHPLEPEWELVRYSQGSVRHRFYPVGGPADNKEMTQAERSRMFVVGQAARLVSATRALDKSKDPGYRAAQKQRVANARDALAPVAKLPEVAALLAKPDDTSGRAVAAAVAGKDYSKELAGKLPDPGTYK